MESKDIQRFITICEKQIERASQQPDLWQTNCMCCGRTVFIAAYQKVEKCPICQNKEPASDEQ